MSNLTSFLNQWPGWLKTIGNAVAIIMLIAAFILMMTGQEGSAKSKKWITYVVIGIAGIYLATSLVASISSAAGN